MNLVDSSGWLEYFADAANADFFAPVILDEAEKIIVPTVVLYEIHKKISEQRDEETALNIVGQLKRHEVIALDEEIAITAAQNSLEHDLPMADSLIYTTAQQYDARLWTQDQDFKNLPDVKYVQKA